MRKFLFSILCATVSFLMALAPSANAKSKSDSDTSKKAKEAEEAAKKEAAKRAKEAEKAAKKAREREEAARKAERLEAERKARARDEALRRARAAAAEASKSGSTTATASTPDKKETTTRIAANTTDAKDAARKAREAEATARHEEAVRKAQEKEAVKRARELEAEQRRARKQQEAELARQARAEEEAQRAIAREAARRQKEEKELAARAEAQKDAARQLQSASAATSDASGVAYEGETFRIIKVPRDGSASVVAPASAAQPAARTESAPVRVASAAPAAKSESSAVSHQFTAGGRGGAATLLPARSSEPAATPDPRVQLRERYSAEEKAAAEKLRARREALNETAPVYVPAEDLQVTTASKSRARSSQARYYEELWEKELAARAAKQSNAEIPVATSNDRRAQARYYEELWRKEQEARAASAATQTARQRAESSPVAVESKPAPAPKAKPQASIATPAPKAVPAAPKSKEEELNAEKARLNASLEASRKSPENSSFTKVQYQPGQPKAGQTTAEANAQKRAAEDAVRKAKEEQEARERAAKEAAARKAAEQAAVKKAEEEARKAREQEAAARKALEAAAAKKAKEEREAMERAEREAAAKARAEEAARRAAEREAAKRAEEERKLAARAEQKQASAEQKRGFFSRFRSDETVGTSGSAPTAGALMTDEERKAQDRALEALRQKQAELDAKESQLRSGNVPPVLPAPSVQAQSSKPVVSAEEAARQERALAAAKAEVESLNKKLANLKTEQGQVTAQIDAAKKELSAPSARDGKKFEVIVDNTDARLVGTWAEGKTGGFYGKDYNFKGKGTGANFAEFTPNLPVAGKYEVFEWHVAGANRAADTPYIINYNGGSQTVTVNQQLNGGKWNSLGTFPFAAGQGGNVRITDAIALQGQMVMADAIRFVLVDGDGGTAVAADKSERERAIEALRIKQDALKSEETRLQNQLEAAKRRVAELEQAAASAATATAPAAGLTEAEIQAQAEEALRRKEAELNAAEAQAKQSRGKKLISVKSATQQAPAEPQRPLTEKERKLAELLRRYKADEITPREYHQERAKILAEP